MQEFQPFQVVFAELPKPEKIEQADSYVPWSSFHFQSLGEHVSITEFVISCLLSGLGYQKFVTTMQFVKRKPPERKEFDLELAHLTKILVQLADDNMDNAINGAVEVFAMSDCCWAVRGFRSPMGTVTFIDVATKKVIAIACLINATKYANFDGKSKAMEGEGTARICERLVEKNIKITSFLHDGDSSSFNAILEKFPNCSDKQCINHGAKNVGKKVKEKIDASFQISVRSWFWSACREASKDSDPDKCFVKKVKNIVKHFGNEHTECGHTKGYDPKNLMNMQQLSILANILQPYYSEPSKYSHGLNQSHCESFNNVILNFMSKSTPLPSMYFARVSLAVLCHNIGFTAAIELIYNTLGLQIDESLRNYLTQRENARTYAADYYQRVGKQKRKTRVRKKYAKSPHTYKETTICKCKSGCKNNHCSCRKNKNFCDGTCGCKNCVNIANYEGKELPASLQEVLERLTQTPE